MLSQTLSLKPVSETAEDFAQVVYNSPGVLRRSTSAVAPDKSELLITHQETGKGAQAADKHNISLRKTIDNAAGTLLPYTVSLTMTQARDVAVTNAMMLDSLRQIIDLVVTTAPITMDSTTVYSLLRGEA